MSNSNMKDLIGMTIPMSEQFSTYSDFNLSTRNFVIQIHSKHTVIYMFLYVIIQFLFSKVVEIFFQSLLFKSTILKSKWVYVERTYI